MVVLGIPQCDCHGWGWCPQPPLCYGRAWMGPWGGNSYSFMDHHLVHSMANG
ncbi:unnamed protein product, partial [Vitis vinifera]|uniref:Uncharacterized protein n=1 Tax=Vitis vinifera TaxID=29760 RepID=D7TAN1_VITVI